MPVGRFLSGAPPLPSRVAYRVGTRRRSKGSGHLSVTKQNLDRRSVTVHEEFCRAVFSRTAAITVLATNYDVLAERGMRHRSRPRVSRPAFHLPAGITMSLRLIFVIFLELRGRVATPARE